VKKDSGRHKKILVAIKKILVAIKKDSGRHQKRFWSP
jgi:hypothetical protein